jgi:hypothetical protein
MPAAIVTYDYYDSTGTQHAKQTYQNVGGVHNSPPFVTLFNDDAEPLPIAMIRADYVRKVELLDNDRAPGEQSSDPASRLLVPAHLAR